jgi:transitional endoplasmic reticulum ATPase
MSAPSSTGSRLQQGLEEARAELDQAKQRQVELNQQIASLQPACEQAARLARDIVVRHARAHASQAISQARRQASSQALGLGAVAGSRRRTLLLWAFLLLGLPWLLTAFSPLRWEMGVTLPPLLRLAGLLMRGYFSFQALFVVVLTLVPSAFVYWLCFLVGRNRLARRASTEVRDYVSQVAGYTARLIHVGTRTLADPKHPHAAVVAPRAQPLESMRFDPALGEMRDSDLVALFSGEAIIAALRLPVAGKTPAVVPFVNFSAAQKSTLEAIAQQAGSELAAATSAPIRALAEVAEQLRPVQEQIDLLGRRVQTLANVQANWADVALAEAALDQILKLVDLFASGRKPAPKGILLYGPPGTGKTLIARKLARHAGCHFEAATIADLKAGLIGQTAPKVKEVFARCRKNAPTLLFVDECESAFARRGGTDTDAFGAELVQTFLSEWDGFEENAGAVLVIGATNRRDILDDAIVSRFTASVEIGLPDAQARRAILGNELDKAGLDLEVPEALVTETSGMSGRDLHTLVASVAADSMGGRLAPDALLAAVRKLRGKGSTQVRQLGWGDIVLPPGTGQEFEGLGKELKNAEQLAKLGIPPPRGILLYGPPGTGKTQIARVLASQSGLGFVAASTADLKANYIGQSGSKVKALFEKARAQAPCILFIDEIDIVAPARDGSGSGDTFTQEIIGQLLQELDGVASTQGQVFLLAASNHPERIDGALLSRMERKVEIGLPDMAGRQAIITLQLAGKPVAFDVQAAAQSLALRTEGASGRDLQSLVTRATRSAVKRAMLHGDDASATVLQIEDLEQALETTQTA